MLIGNGGSRKIVESCVIINRDKDVHPIIDHALLGIVEYKPRRFRCFPLAS